MSATYESVLLVKSDTKVYRIPPRQSNRGYRAADWSLETPDWTGKLKLVAEGSALTLRLEDNTSGDLFAKCPVDCHPGVAIEPVTDSSRYFVIRLQDDNGRAAFIGLGFNDRSDSFDLNVAIQDHFKSLKVEEEAAAEAESGDPQPVLDLGFKEGQTITLNLNTRKGDGEEEGDVSKARQRTRAAMGVSPSRGGGLLPPPPASKTRGRSPDRQRGSASPRATSPAAGSSPMTPSNADLLGDLAGLGQPQCPTTTRSNVDDLLG